MHALHRISSLARPRSTTSRCYTGVTPASLRAAHPIPVEKPATTDVSSVVPEQKKHVNIKALKQKQRDAAHLKQPEATQPLEERKSQLVEYVHQSKRYLGILFKDPSGQPLVLTTPQKPLTINENQITFSFSSEVKYMLAELPNVQRLADDLVEMITQDRVQEFWKEFLAQKKSFDAKQMASVLFMGSTTMHAQFAAHRILSANHLLFKQIGPGLWTCRSEAAIKALSQASATQTQQAMDDTRFFQQLRSLIRTQAPEVSETLRPVRGVTEEKSSSLSGIMSPSSLEASRVEMLRQYALSMHGLPDIQKRLLEPIGLASPGQVYPPRELLGLLDRLGLHSREANPILVRFASELNDFPPQIVSVAEQAVKSPPDPSTNRLRFEELTCYTVDDASALEIDDGLSYLLAEDNTHWVYMHIADPTRFIEPNGPLDLHARQRGVTVYLPDKHFPMLPEVVVRSCSLAPDVENHALTIAVNLDDHANMVGYKVAPSILRRVTKLTYAHVDQLLAKGRKPKEDTATAKVMHSLNKLGHARLKKRVALGAKAGNSYRPELKLESNGAISISESASSPARDLVAEFMILANEVAAEFCMANRIPTPYRTQAAKAEEKLYRPSITSVYSNPHYGLGVPFYVHVTSPIRRYTDCLVHQNIKHHLAGRPPPYSAEMLAKIVESHEMKLRRVKSIQKHSSIYWTLKYLEQEQQKKAKLGERDILHDAVVSVAPRKEQLTQQPGAWTDMVTLIFPPSMNLIPIKLKSSARPLVQNDKVKVRFVDLDPIYESATVEVL